MSSNKTCKNLQSVSESCNTKNIAVWSKRGRGITEEKILWTPKLLCAEAS